MSQKTYSSDQEYGKVLLTRKSEDTVSKFKNFWEQKLNSLQISIKLPIQNL